MTYLSLSFELYAMRSALCPLRSFVWRANFFMHDPSSFQKYAKCKM